MNALTVALLAMALVLAACGERRENVVDPATGATLNCVVKRGDAGRTVELSKCYRVE